MVENIVFDLGNVLVDFKPLGWLTSEYGSKDGEFLYHNFCLSPLWVDLDRGGKSLKEVEHILCREYPDKTDLIKDVVSRYFGMLTPIDEGVRLLEQLVFQGYSVFYLTNYHAEAFSYLKNTYSWFHHFRGGICSAHCGLLKPDPAIYQLLCHEVSIKPEETLFLDDTAENVKAAELLGFQTLIVDDPSKLGQQIRMKLT